MSSLSPSKPRTTISQEAAEGVDLMKEFMANVKMLTQKLGPPRNWPRPLAEAWAAIYGQHLYMQIRRRRLGLPCLDPLPVISILEDAGWDAGWAKHDATWATPVEINKEITLAEKEDW